MKLAIMFINIPEIHIYTLPDYIKEDGIEDYIFNNLGLSLSEISWRVYHTEDEITIRLR